MPRIPDISTHGSDWDFLYLPSESRRFPASHKALLTLSIVFMQVDGIMAYLWPLFFFLILPPCGRIINGCIHRKCILYFYQENLFTENRLFQNQTKMNFRASDHFFPYLVPVRIIGSLCNCFWGLTVGLAWWYNRAQNTVPPSRSLDREDE